MRSGGGHRGYRLAVASVALLVVAAGLLRLGSAPGGPPDSNGTTDVAPGQPAAAPGRALPTPAVLGRSAPVSLSIPAIGVAARGLAPLGRGHDGTLEVPTDFDQPGWYHLGPAPGQPGAAVLVGHVDSLSGPAVFWRLGQVRTGDHIRIGRADGNLLTFTVYAVQRFPKDGFPTARVYGGTHHRAELRVITCGGSFDQDTGHYRSNTVVFATLTHVGSGSAQR